MHEIYLVVATIRDCCGGQGPPLMHAHLVCFKDVDNNFKDLFGRLQSGSFKFDFFSRTPYHKLT